MNEDQAHVLTAAVLEKDALWRVPFRPEHHDELSMSTLGPQDDLSPSGTTSCGPGSLYN